MTKISLYWSNICILHKYEKDMLDKVTVRLKEHDIQLNITYFGLGYPLRMAQYLIQPAADLPDLIFSTDLEVFENPEIFDKFNSELHPLQDFYEIKEEIKITSINQRKELLPFLIIPLVFSSNHCEILQDLSIREVIEKKIPLIFGGLGNSAAKSVVKAVWDTYGKSALTELLEHSTIMDMPIQAFQNIRIGSSPLALVPSIYARRADNDSLFIQYPTDGAVAVPSFIAARKSISKEYALVVLNEILTEEFLNYFVNTGDLVCCLKKSPSHTMAAENHHTFLYPSSKWIMDTSQKELQEIYREREISFV